MHCFIIIIVYKCITSIITNIIVESIRGALRLVVTCNYHQKKCKEVRYYLYQCTPA